MTLKKDGITQVNTSSSGGGTDVNITEVGGVPVGGGSLPVTGPLTDTQLRATPVPISGTITVVQPVTVQASNLDIRDLVFAQDKVDVTGSTVTANAGTNLNTSALALEAGNLATILTRLTSILAQLDVALSTRVAEATFSPGVFPAAANDAEGIANPTASKIWVFPRLRNNSGTWDKQRSVDAIGDGVVGTGIAAHGNWGYNGTDWERIRNLANAVVFSRGVLAAGVTAQFDDVAPGVVSENSWAGVRMSTNRNLYITIRDAAGNERGLNIDATGAISVTAPKSGTTSRSDVADSAVSVQLLAANTGRLGATIANDSSAPLFVNLQATASITNYTVRIPQYGYYEVPFNYTGRIDGIWETDPGDGAARMTELTA